MIDTYAEVSVYLVNNIVWFASYVIKTSIKFTENDLPDALPPVIM